MWRFFWSLDRRRQGEETPQPIQYQEIESLARLTGLGKLSRLETQALDEMESARLSTLSRIIRAKVRDPGNPRPNPTRTVSFRNIDAVEALFDRFAEVRDE